MTPKKKKKTYDQIETELRLLKANCLWDNVSKVIAPNIKWAALTVIAKYASDAIGELSGKITAASIDLKAAFNPEEAGASWPYWVAAISAHYMCHVSRLWMESAGITQTNNRAFISV